MYFFWKTFLHFSEKYYCGLVLTRICVFMYYSSPNSYTIYFLVLHWTRYCALGSGVLPRHEFAIDSGGRHLLLTSNLTTAPLYQVSMPLFSHTFCPLYIDRLCWTDVIVSSACSNYQILVSYLICLLDCSGVHRWLKQVWSIRHP